MIKARNFSVIVEDMKVDAVPYGFEKKHDKLVLSPGLVETVSKAGYSSHHLPNCFAAVAGGACVIRSGLIDSPLKGKELLAVVKKALKKSSFRLCSGQINSVEHEWALIDRQHHILEHLHASHVDDVTVVHVVNPLEKVYGDAPQQKKIKRLEETYGKLEKLFNISAWVRYCAWYNERLEEAFAHFLYDAVDEYSLERYLKDFRHEVKSTLLKRTYSRLKEAESSIGQHHAENHLSDRELVNHEKNIFLLRMDLQRMVRAHYGSLVEIVRLIPMIEVAHPDLVDLKITGMALKALLADQLGEKDAPHLGWGAKEMLLQLLNGDLGVVSAVNGEHGLGRTHFSFAIRLAVEQLKDKFARSGMVEAAIHWEEAARTLNKITASHREVDVAGAIEAMLDFALKQHVKIVHRLQYCVLMNLVHLCEPLTRLNIGQFRYSGHNGLYENRELLSFLSSHHTLLNAIEEPERVPLMEYDAATGDPLGLTDAGHRFLMSLNF